MSKARPAEAEIIAVLKQVDAGRKAEDVVQSGKTHDLCDCAREKRHREGCWNNSDAASCGGASGSGVECDGLEDPFRIAKENVLYLKLRFALATISSSVCDLRIASTVPRTY